MLRDIETWLRKRIPAEWFASELDITADGEEILIIGTLPAPTAGTPAEAIRRFRESTRDRRVAIASEAEARFGRPVSWGARSGDVRLLFTTNSVPVMTRLRMPERQVLDTLIASGVARTRSDALAWCVRLVADHEGDWLKQLNDALVHVEKVRAAGPTSRQGG